MFDRLPPLQTLRAFEATGRLLSMTLAAEELHVTHGAVSRHIKTLENHLGVALFERLTRRIVLTEAGAEFLLSVTRVLGELTFHDAARVIKESSILCLPLGAIEQHGAHLPLNTDVVVAEGLTSRLLARWGGEFDLWQLPTLSIGLSREHDWAAGTLGLSIAGFAAYMRDLAGAIVRALPARNLAIVNGHGGNRGMLENLLHELRGALDRPEDAHMRAAAAEVRLHVRPDVGVGGIDVLPEQCLRAHHHAGDAIAALRRLLLDECPLHGAGILDRAEPLDGSDLAALEEKDRRHTGEGGLAVDEHGAGAAVARIAADLSTFKPQILAQHLAEPVSGRSGDLDLPTVERETDEALCGLKLDDLVHPTASSSARRMSVSAASLR